MIEKNIIHLLEIMAVMTFWNSSRFVVFLDLIYCSVCTYLKFSLYPVKETSILEIRNTSLLYAFVVHSASTNWKMSGNCQENHQIQDIYQWQMSWILWFSVCQNIFFGVRDCEAWLLPVSVFRVIFAHDKRRCGCLSVVYLLAVQWSVMCYSNTSYYTGV